MSRKRRVGTNALIEKLISGEITDTHHLIPKGKGGSNKKSNKKEVPILGHRLWHLLVGDSLPEEAAKILSFWIGKDVKLFAISKNSPAYKTIQEINVWLSESDIKIKVVSKQPKIIKFHPHQKTSFREGFPKIVS